MLIAILFVLEFVLKTIVTFDVKIYESFFFIPETAKLPLTFASSIAQLSELFPPINLDVLAIPVDGFVIVDSFEKAADEFGKATVLISPAGIVTTPFASIVGISTLRIS